MTSTANLGPFSFVIPEELTISEQRGDSVRVSGGDLHLEGKATLIEDVARSDGAFQVAQRASQPMCERGATIDAVHSPSSQVHAIWLAGPGGAERSTLFAYQSESTVLLIQFRGIVLRPGDASSVVERLTDSVRF